MKKIATIIGARPQFIKAAPLSTAIKNAAGIEEILIHTGQHFDPNMSDIFFNEMGIPAPNYKLNIHSLSHGAMTGRMLEAIEEILLREQPHMVLVFGDTNSTLAGALAAKKLHIPVAHVEAGLRSFNMRMPEEVNRILTDRISDLLFCPTQSAVENLQQEGFKAPQNKVVLCGDIMQDSMNFFGQFAPKRSEIKELKKMDSYVLCTLHRAENTNHIERLKSIIEGLNQIHQNIPVLLPLHPRTAQILKDQQIPYQFKIIEPVGYLTMISLLKHSSLVLTDSGGLQKEAYMNQKYCITLRDETEWVELTQAGVNFIAGANSQTMVTLAQKYLSLPFKGPKNLYGDGKTAQHIVTEMDRLMN